jgi:sulfatase modifying factor 1
MKASLVVATLIVALSPCAYTFGTITIGTVPIGDVGNPNDPATGNLNGGVNYAYSIGTTEVTNAQYVAFLNAVAKSDPYGLYSTSMNSSVFGGINRNGSVGSYTYAIKASALNGTYTYDNKPVVYVSWGDSARFANWLNNGQPTGAEGAGTTETGGYTLNGAITDAALMAVTRNPGATWCIPTENEWYKAAYYNPSTSTYYQYPTSSNSEPNNNPPSSDTGNSANFYNPNNGYATGNISFPLTDAGAYTLSHSPYGTFDQGGNAFEWNETAIPNSLRGCGGGSWNEDYAVLRSSYSLHNIVPTYAEGHVGFRVASIPAPEPTSILLAGVGVLLRGSLRRRR